jgi:hypothetical protein
VSGADSTRNRDWQAAIASSELNGASLDSALEVLLFEDESFAALARLTPEQVAEMRAEAETLAEAAPDPRRLGPRHSAPRRTMDQ